LLSGASISLASASSRGSKVENRLGEVARGFLRQVVADAAADQPMLVPAREPAGV
jgi:hypothetical protein